MDWNEATHGAVDEAIKSSDIVKNAKSIADIAKQAVDYQRLYGGAIRIPGENSSESDRADFQAKMVKAGLVPKDKFVEYVRPEKADGYKYDGEIPEGIKIAQTQVDSIKSRAHALGLSNDQFKMMMKSELDTMVSQTTAQAQRLSEATTALKGEWGQAYDAKMRLAEAAAMSVGGEAARAAFAANPDPIVAKAYAKLGEAIQESGRTDLQRILPSVETRGEAEVKLAEIRANKDHPFNNRSKVPPALYEAAQAEVLRLQAMALGLKPGKDPMFDEVA